MWKKQSVCIVDVDNVVYVFADGVFNSKIKKNVAHYCRDANMAVFGNFCPKNAREHNQIILLWDDQVMVVIFVLFLIMYYILFLPRKSVLVCFFAVWPPLPATDTVYHFYQKIVSLIKKNFYVQHQNSSDYWYWLISFDSFIIVLK